MSNLSKIVSYFGGSVKTMVFAMLAVLVTFGVVLAPASVDVVAQGSISYPVAAGGVTLDQSTIVERIFSFVRTLIYIFAGIMVAIMAWGGFLWGTNKPDEGMKWVKNGATGLVIAGLSFIIVQIIIGVIGILTSALTTP